MKLQWKRGIWPVLVSLLVIAGAVGAYLAFPRLLVRSRCVDWPDHTLAGLKLGREYLYVAMGACNIVIAIDTQSHTVVAAARLEGSFPHGIAVALDARELYAANERSDNVSVISLPDLSPTASIPVGDFPTDVVPSMDGKRMFVANFKGGSVQVIDLIGRSVTREVAGPRATHFAVSPNGERLYVTHWEQNRLSILDGRDGALIKTITLTGKPNHATVSRGSRRIYVTLYGDSALAVIDAARLNVITSIPVGLHPMAPVVSPDDRWVYVSNIDGGTLSIIDAKRLTVVGEIRTGGNPQHLVMGGAGRTLWVTNPLREVVQVIDLIRRRVIREIYAGPEPQQMAPRYLAHLSPENRLGSAGENQPRQLSLK